MRDIFGFFPFDMGPTEAWAFIYLMMAIPVLLVTRKIRDVVGEKLDEPPRRSGVVQMSTAGGAAYRMAAAPPVGGAAAGGPPAAQLA